MKHVILRAAAGIALATALAAAPAFAQNIAVVNNKPIPKAKADEMIAALVKQGQKDTPELEQMVRDDLITREVLMQEVEKRNLANDPEVQAQIERSRDQVLIVALAQDYIKNNPPTDAEIHQKFDDLVKAMPPKEYHARHILVKTESQAKAIIAKLKGGAAFEDLAKQSEDPGSADKGGDLGWAPPTAFAQPFGDALVKLQPGKFTDTPVKTQFGYHVIKLEAVRDTQAPAFDKAKDQVAGMIMQDRAWQQERFKTFVDGLRAKAKIE